MANAAFVRSRSDNNFGVQAEAASTYALPRRATGPTWLAVG